MFPTLISLAIFLFIKVSIQSNVEFMAYLYNASIWITQATVGSDKRIVQLTVDTGSSDTIIPSVGSKVSHEIAVLNMGYASGESSDFKDLQVAYDSTFGDGGEIHGVYCSDSFSLGGADLSDFKFVFVNKSENPTSGLLGLGAVADEYYITSYDNYPLALYKQGKIDSPVMNWFFPTHTALKFVFGSYDSSQNCDTPLGTHDLGAVMTGDIGGSYGDNNNSSSTAYTEILQYGTNITGISCNGEAFVGLKSTYAFFDTGYQFIGIPSDVFQEIGKQYSWDYSNSSKTWSANCSTVASDTIEFEFEDQKLNFSVASFVTGIGIGDFGPSCQLAFRESVTTFYQFGTFMQELLFLSVDLDKSTISMCQQSDKTKELQKSSTDISSVVKRETLYPRGEIKKIEPLALLDGFKSKVVFFGKQRWSSNPVEVVY